MMQLDANQIASNCIIVIASGVALEPISPGLGHRGFPGDDREGQVGVALGGSPAS
jgi:hypothetical protein